MKTVTESELFTQLQDDTARVLSTLEAVAERYSALKMEREGVAYRMAVSTASEAQAAKWTIMDLLGDLLREMRAAEQAAR